MHYAYSFFGGDSFENQTIYVIPLLDKRYCMAPYFRLSYNWLQTGSILSSPHRGEVGRGASEAKKFRIRFRANRPPP